MPYNICVVRANSRATIWSFDHLVIGHLRLCRAMWFLHPISARLIHSRLSTHQLARSTYWLFYLLIATVLVLTACKSNATPTPTPIPTRLTGDLTGTLVLENGCLRVTSRYGSGSYTLVFAPELTVTVDGDAILVFNEATGQTVVVYTGQLVFIGGGAVYSSEQFGDEMQARLPANCPGPPYWFAGSVEPLEASDTPE
jgi:hypothetical protein